MALVQRSQIKVSLSFIEQITILAISELNGAAPNTLKTKLNTLTRDLLLQPSDNQRLANLCGQLDENLRLIEKRLGIEIFNRGNEFKLQGDADSVQAGYRVLKNLYRSTQDTPLTPHEVHLVLAGAAPEEDAEQTTDNCTIRTKRCIIKPRGINQYHYVRNIQKLDINFGIGPAGTGKTYIAVACAVKALEKDEVRRIVLVRPAVEAGEKLGFLPGDLTQKVDPYLRPLYDALYEMLGFDQVARLIERNVIEVAPLAYMRGRTLNDSFIILDESQNTTREQMKMFLTRIGFSSKAVITGDITQIDLPRHSMSGLLHARQVLKKVEGIGFNYFKAHDVVRHALVQRIVEAYDEQDSESPS